MSAQLNRILVAPVDGPARDVILGGLGARPGIVLELAVDLDRAMRLVEAEQYDFAAIVTMADGEDARGLVRVLRQQEALEERAPTPVVALGADGSGEALLIPLAECLDRWVPRLDSRRTAPPVHPSMLDLIPGFVRRRREDLVVLREAFARDALEELRQTAHKMRGSGTTYGFPWLSEIGEQLERAAEDGDLDAIRSGLIELEDVLEGFPGF